MAVPEEDRLVITAWTGSYDAAEHAPIYDVYGDGHLVALHCLRQRLNSVLAGPARAEVDGDYEEDWEATIRSLERQIERLENVCLALGLDVATGEGTVTVNSLTKSGVRDRSYVLADGTRVR